MSRSEQRTQRLHPVWRTAVGTMLWVSLAAALGAQESPAAEQKAAGEADAAAERAADASVADGATAAESAEAPDAERAWYYVRLHCTDDELAWSSPIWFVKDGK